MPNCDAVILCGGLGTRLQSLHPYTPKALVPVSGRPFLEYLIRQLKSAGHTRVILAVGHLRNQIQEYVSAYHAGSEIVLSVEHEPLGTGGAVRNASAFVTSEHVVILNGDSYCPADLGAFYRFHAGHSGTVSLVATPVDARADAGFMVVGDDGRLLAFREREPQADQRPVMSAGIYYFDASILSSIPYSCSLEYDFFPSVVSQGAAYAFIQEHPTYDIGTPERLRAAETVFATFS